MEYYVVFEYSRETLMRSVRDKIGEGWEPIGGVAITFIPRERDEDLWFYYQAMIRRVD